VKTRFYQNETVFESLRYIITSNSLLS